MHLSQDEIVKFLAKKGITAQFIYEDENIDLLIISSLLNPYDEEISYDLYDKGVPDIKLERFEEYYVKELKPNALLMSLKLSNDQQRLKRVLQTKAFDDQTYLKLFKLYNWRGEGVFDNNENRDVTLSFINRFFKAQGEVNHTDIAHSPATLIEIALSSDNPELLESMTKIPNLKTSARKQERWKPKNLHEFIALNPNISTITIEYFLSLQSSRFDMLLALNKALKQEHQFTIFNRAGNEPKQHLAKNPNLSLSLFKELLQEAESVVATLLTHQKITKEYFAVIPKKYYMHLCSNPEIAETKERLLGISEELDIALAANPIYTSSELEELFRKYKEKIAKSVTANPNTPSNILQELYEGADKTVLLNIAANPNTPATILEELYNQNSQEINRSLALNPSLKDEYLDYFKLDSQLLQIMSNNPKFLTQIMQHKEPI